MSQLERAMSLKEAPSQRSFCFYGPAGTGKTTAMCLHPGKGFVIDSNCKLHEMRNLDPATRDRVTIWQPSEPLVGEDIEVTQIDPKRKKPEEGALRQWAEKPKGYDEIREVTNDLIKLAYKCQKDGTPFPYNWIGHDAFTHTLRHIEYSSMARHGYNLLNQSLYEVVKRDILSYMNGWQRLGSIAKVDTIMIAHSRDYYDEDGKLQSRKPIITGQWRDMFFTDFTEVYFFRGGSSDGRWYVQTYNDGKADARTSAKLERIQVVDAKAFYA